LISSRLLLSRTRSVISGPQIARYFAFIVYCCIPFLGGNHLPLYYINIDKFWIENIFLLSLIISIILCFYTNKEGLNSSLWKRFSSFFLPFLAINVFSLFFTWNTLSTLKEINTLSWVVGVVFLVCVFPDKGLVLKALVVGAFLSSVCAIVQFTILYPKLIDMHRDSQYALLVGSQTIPFSSFLYHNIFGGYLACVLPISIYYAIFEKKILYSITTIIILTALVLTTTRIGITLAVLSALASLILSIRDHDAKRFFHIAALVCVGLLIAVLLMGTNTKGAPDGVQREIKQKITNLPVQIKTLNTRTQIWKVGLKAFIKKPMFGYGAGTFEYPYKKYFDGGIGTKYAHSTIIKIAVELGIAGIICWFFYLAGCLIWLQNVFWSRKNVFIAFSALSYFLFGVVDFSFDTPAHVLTFFLLTGLLSQFETEKGLFCEKAKMKKLIHYGIFGSIILLCMVSFYFTTRLILSSKAIETGNAMAENGFPIDAVYNAYEDAIKTMSLNNEGYIKAAGTLIALSYIDKDMTKKQEAKIILSSHLRKMEKSKDKDPELFYTTGIGYATIGNNEKADYYLTKALSYLPSSSYYVFGLAEYYFNIGDYGKAKQTIKSFAPYINNYETTRNPNGFYVYKMRDLEAEMELREGNPNNAILLARENLKDAERERFVITSARARGLVTKEFVVSHLQERIDQIKSRGGKH
jgi:O-antigen ligase